MISHSIYLSDLLHLASKYIHVLQRAKFLFFFTAEEYTFVPHLPYPFICWWTLRLLPYLGYYKECCCLWQGEVVVVVVWSLSLACSLPGSSVHGILKAWLLEWVAIPFCRVSPQPRDRTGSPALAGSFFTTWATWETCKLRRGQPNLLYFKDSCEALRDTHYHEEISWTIISSPSTPRWPLAPKTLLATSRGQLQQFAAWLSDPWGSRAENPGDSPKWAGP